MASVNKVILVGNVGRDPEVKYTQGGKSVCNFSLATNEKWKDKSGETQEQTEWHRIVCWGKLAEICGEYLAKGREVYIEGRIQTREWQDKDGGKRYTTEVNAREVQFLGGRDGGSRSASSTPTQRRPSDDPYSASGDDGSDDVPF